MEVVIVKGAGGRDPDRTYLGRGGESERAAVHVVHDLPHLVIESLFGMDDGLWAELEQGMHREAARAGAARDPMRQKLGRIVSGAASGASTGEWLTEGHGRAKVVTNCVLSAIATRTATPAEIRRRLAACGDAAIDALLERVDDETIALAIRGVADLRQSWNVLPVGGVLRLTWPLPRSRFDQN